MLFGLGAKNSLHMPQTVYDEIIAHAKDSYPNECCGVLVGGCYKGRRVFECHRVTNINIDRAMDRYVIDPKELNLIDKMSRVQGMDIVGFYHSHPDHPAKPSETDREWGQPGYSYVIVSVKGGKEVQVRSWSFDHESEPFSEEKLRVGEKGR